MIDLQKAYISQAIYLVSNVLDKRIRYRQEEAENSFSSLIAAQSQQTNLPDDFDPSQPRLVFQSAQKQMVVSQIACQLSLGFESATKGVDNQLEIIIKNVRDAHKKIEGFKGKESLRESALVIVLSFPSDSSRSDLGEFIFSKFVKMPRYAEVASTSVKTGYLLPNGIFLNIEADIYEKRGGPIQVTAGASVDLLSLPIVEMGVSVKLDINTRPQALSECFANPGPEELISLVQKYCPSEIYKLLELV
ncbi:hypothetical protein [Pseudomonas sp. BF-R-01]|uniref:hypothetical protein n=1 Tax=Pseudomonas sp. BF-R-01 TaxID=2832365 RepID=UPI001CBEBC00|nr:hypothetical protein [Pseudomonas sp. BF-R-01]